MVTGVRGDRARQTLAGTRFGAIRWVDETGSTNRDLLDRAEADEPEGVVMLADHQSEGRGRLDRTWHAPAGGSLLVSVLMRPTLAVADAHVLTTAMALSAAEACAAVAGVTPRLKWPNDLVIAADADGAGGPRAPRKLAGILAESILDGRDLTAVVVGMGLNVNWPDDLPTDLADIAIALNHVAGHDVDREDLLIALLERLDHWYGRAIAGAEGRADLVDQARDLSITLGARVRVDLGTETIEGRADDLTLAGALVVTLTTGERRTVVAGDVVHLRPGD
jgi:BirA family transcriptional regulator, biotin operon repressor / biotin---[acetyl-CoA-carboxylase] ligase